MKRAFAVSIASASLFLGGCADELEQPTTQEVGEHFERGVKGEGTIGPRDRSDDPYVQSDTPSAPAPARVAPSPSP